MEPKLNKRKGFALHPGSTILLAMRAHAIKKGWENHIGYVKRRNI